MKVKIKKLVQEATIPSYAKEGDAGMDLTAISFEVTDTYTEYGTGLSIEIPKGFVGLLFPRSSISKKTQYLANSVGVIDSGYRGEIKIRFKTDDPLYKAYVKNIENSLDQEHEAPLYMIGERVAQLIIIPHPEVEFQEVEELSSTARGEGGFGSTGHVMQNHPHDGNYYDEARWKGW